MKKNLLAYIFFLFILYMFFFYPPFGPFRVIFGISNIISLAGIVLYLINPSPVREFVSQHRKIFKIMVFTLFYSILSIMVEHDTGLFTAHFLFLTNCFLVVPQLLCFAKKNGFGTENDIVRSILVVISVSSIVSLLCVSFPNFNSYIKYDVIKYAQDDFLFDVDYRGFGFASLLTSNYGFILGFVSVLGVFYLSENRWFLFFIPLLIVAALLNARTGVVIAFAGFSVYLLLSGGFKNIFYGVLVAILGIVLVSNIEMVLNLIGVNDETIKWLTYFTDEIDGLTSTGSVQGSQMATTLLDDMWIWPDNVIQWIFGRGYILFRNTHGVMKSDVGWVNELNFGGLVYFLPLLYMFYLVYKQLKINKGRSLALFVFITIIIVNTKGRLYPQYSIFYIMMMVMMVTTRNKSSMRLTNKDVTKRLQDGKY